ncbi:MAG: N-acetylmuramoyl-L-alanine amidase [Rhodospirillaceae bacterium]
MSSSAIGHPSPNFNARPDGAQVDMLVLHYTGMRTGAAALDRLCDPAAQVSAHYLIEEDGRVFQLVAEAARAWHAGVSSWRGNANVNDRSVGIELVNPGHEYGYRPFADAQMTALRELAAGILGRHPIPARNVVGHSDVAPTRKQDPGELFDWRGLAAAGIGLWPAGGADPLAEEDAAAALAEIGYDVADLAAALTAFQLRFRPDRVDGVCDAATRARLAAVTAML